ncbi:MAG: SAM-dependent methyltransferase [Clostridium sp.]|nr:SAM-dependent methyltransferase [Acetatifactor muris]MCM1525756.1 SAM-dependent methyltransferase [Bacteroides sp.]MCM1564090.1 SAM-dependent methyltransferase [Clostridium sp.]
MIGGWTREFVCLYGESAVLPFDGDGRNARLWLYAVQTCFSLILKTIMREILKVIYDKTKGPGRSEEPVCSEESDRSTSGLLRGEFAVRRGIENYVEQDWYCWPLYELQNGFADIVGELEELLAAYRTDLSVEELAGRSCGDDIRQIYEAMIPREIRHALGEFHTPDALAERTLTEALQYVRRPLARLRIADPTCGSGTFLMQAIRMKRRAGCGPEEILDSVYGFDINPLAVLAAKTNYLLAMADLLRGTQKVRLPVYKMDILRLAESVSGDLENVSMAWQNDLFDVVIGNPPWVNWEYMPQDYRRGTGHLWMEYGLFDAKGRELSFAKEDISVLITYVVMDKLLGDDGVIGFVLRRVMFKSSQNGAGFRRFRIKEECDIRVLQVDDLSRLRIFGRVMADAALFVAQKGAKTVYPVPYRVWSRSKSGLKSGTKAGLKTGPKSEWRRFKGESLTAAELLRQARMEEQCAMPSIEGNPTSPWITAAPESLEAMRQVLGRNPYRARTGVFTGGANGVYLLQILESGEGKVRVRNLVGRAKRKVEQIEAELEPAYIFPMIRGRDVGRWRVGYECYLLCPHTKETKMRPVAGEELRRTCPLTYDYLSRFRGELDARKGFAGWEKEIQRQEFHAVLRVGEYTFSRYKVIWKYIATEFVCAVIGETDDPYLGRKICLPNEKIMYVSTDDETEAYYLCGMLSSPLIANCVKSYMNPTGISVHVLDKLNIPAFDAEDERHRAIAAICKEGHGKQDIQPYLDRIDGIAAQIYTNTSCTNSI